MRNAPHLNCGSFKPLSSVSAIQQFKPFQDKPKIKYQPKRKRLEAPADDGTFILPMKQSFMKNPRLGHGTKIMLSILLGLNGAGGVLKITTGTIGKMMNRTRRTIYSYIQEAVEEGYLTYSKLKSRIGYYIGLKIYLNRMALMKSKNKPSNEEKPLTLPKTAESSDVQFSSEINRNINNTIKDDKELMEKLTSFALEIGYIKQQT